jgi:hypothetical protein
MNELSPHIRDWWPSSPTGSDRVRRILGTDRLGRVGIGRCRCRLGSVRLGRVGIGRCRCRLGFVRTDTAGIGRCRWSLASARRDTVRPAFVVDSCRCRPNRVFGRRGIRWSGSRASTWESARRWLDPGSSDRSTESAMGRATGRCSVPTPTGTRSRQARRCRLDTSSFEDRFAVADRPDRRARWCRQGTAWAAVADWVHTVRQVAADAIVQRGTSGY